MAAAQPDVACSQAEVYDLSHVLSLSKIAFAHVNSTKGAMRLLSAWILLIILLTVKKSIFKVRCTLYSIHFPIKRSSKIIFDSLNYIKMLRL